MSYFELQEFEDPTLPGSGVNMDINFLRMLNDARKISGIPYKITSGYRSIEHNKTVGGVTNSSHLTGKAADIAVGGGSQRYVILNSLIKAGFKRLGVAKTFIHCDTDESKPNSVWTY